MIDIDQLVSPISDESPAGENLRLRLSDTTIQTILDERTEISSIEDPAGEGRSANWPVVQRTCLEALSSETKDLEVAAWLCEALAHQEGFSGLHQGLQLVTQLTRVYWQQVHPGIDEDDGELVLPSRARPLTWMGTSKDFLRAVSACAIVKSADGKVLGWFDYSNTELVDQKQALSDQTSYQEMIESGYIGGEEWTSRINSMDSGALHQVVSSVKDCETALAELRSSCDELFEEDEPNFVGLGELLLEIREYLEARVPDGAEFAPEVDQDGTASAVASSQGAASGAAAGPIAGRDDALRRLSEVAQYFQRTEPHSPIAHLIQRTVRWGNMSLPDLLTEIVKDEDVLNRIWDTLGIQVAPNEDEG